MATQNLPKVPLNTFLQFFGQRTVRLQYVLDYEGQPIEKVLKYWRKNNLVPFIESGAWARVSYAQLIWLRVLDTMRQFNFTTQKMKIVCDYFMADAYEDELPKLNLKEAINQLNQKKAATSLSDQEEKRLQDHIYILEHHEFMLQLLKEDVNYLTNLIHIGFNSDQEPGILIFSDNTIGEALNNEYHFSHREKTINSQKPHVYISIRYFLEEFIDNDDLSGRMLPQILDETEIYVLSLLQDKNIKEMTIELTSGKIEKIEVTETGLIADAKVKEIKRILGLQNYERITISTRDEKTLSFKKIIQK